MRGNSYLPSSRLTSRASDPSTAWSRRKARLRFALFLPRLWLLIAWWRSTRPVPVSLKRFFVALLVFCLGTGGLHGLAGSLRRAEHHDHVAAVLEGRGLDLADVLHVVGQAHEEVAPTLGMALLAAAEHDRDLDLRARVQEPLHVALLRLVVVISDLRSHLDFLDMDLRLVLARRLRLLLLLVPVLAVVHDPGDRRIGVGSDLDEVEVLPEGVLESVVTGLHADLSAVGVDE